MSAPNTLETAARTAVNAMREAGYPMDAVACTPTFFLARRYGHRFTRLPLDTRQAFAREVSRALGQKIDNAPSSVGQYYA